MVGRLHRGAMPLLAMTCCLSGPILASAIDRQLVPPSCLAPGGGGRSGLLREEERTSWAVRDHPDSAAAWHALACVRAHLELAGGTGRFGVEMTSGDAWNFGAINASMRAIRLDPRSPAAELLGWIVLQERAEDLRPEILPMLQRAVDAGSKSPALLRGCAQLSIQRSDATLARRCLRLGLSAGSDSTFHLLRLARLAYRDGDALSGQDAFLHAADAAHTPDDREDLGWHLQWFVSPDELGEWEALPDSLTGEWVRDRLATRDLRDGRAPGRRLQEHFARLEHVMTHFVLRLPRVAWKAGGLTAATPETGGGEDPDLVRGTCEPGAIPARPYRFYSRWQNAIDDRGVVWMRFGAPDTRVALSPQCPTGPPPPNVREGWVYHIDGAQLLLQFENERFDGSAAATRLVTGVLGSYLCGLDAWRCALTERAKDGKHPLPQEQLQVVIISDAEMVAIGTTKDDNSPRGVQPLRVTGDVRRLWDPRTEAPIVLATWAIRLEDIVSTVSGKTRSAETRVTIRRWARTTGDWHDTTLIRHSTLPDTASGKRFLTGMVVLPGGADLSAWSVVVTQADDRMGRAWDDAVPARGSGSVIASDIVLGSARQGLRWDAGTESIPLAPLGTVNRSTPATLYFQLLSERAMPSATTRISIYRDDGGNTAAEPVLRISSQTPLTAGLNPILREIDFSRLDSGRHRIEVELIAPDGKVLTSRFAALLLE